MSWQSPRIVLLVPICLPHQTPKNWAKLKLLPVKSLTFQSQVVLINRSESYCEVFKFCLLTNEARKTPNELSLKKWEMKREYEQKDILMSFIANRTSANHKNWPIVIVFALAA